MRPRHNRAEIRHMKIKGARFRRNDRLVATRRSLRGEILALRYELELLDEALHAGSGAPPSARVALEYAFTHLRAAEHAWQAVQVPVDMLVIVGRLDEARDALEASVAARASGTRAGV
jgi:hypothetical protein